MVGGKNDQRVYLIDASVYIFRGWFALPASMTDDSGQPINALHGFADFLARLIAQVRPAHIAVAFDESLTNSFRNQIDPAYKANRESAPDELKAQFARCRELCAALGLWQLASPEFEADDFIATLTAQAHAEGRPVCIVSRDKDLAQLLQAGDTLWDFAADQHMDPDGVVAKFGVRADQMLDYQALVGDAVDNIPGIAGIGPKAAVALLAAHDTLDAVYAHLDEVAALPVRGAKRLQTLLREHRDDALRSRELARLRGDVPLPAGTTTWTPGVDEAAIRATGLGSAATRRLLDALAG